MQAVKLVAINKTARANLCSGGKFCCPNTKRMFPHVAPVICIARKATMGIASTVATREERAVRLSSRKVDSGTPARLLAARRSFRSPGATSSKKPANAASELGIND